MSRRKIGQIMAKLNLVSVYTKAKYKPYSTGCNESDTPNILDRQFDREQPLDIVVSDLTYVKVGQTWHYICLILDLWNREVIGWSVGAQRDAKLVRDAFYNIPYRLDRINIFHSDRGKEFDNKLIEEVITGFDMTRSLSAKGCPYDNAVIESTNHLLKAEFIYQYKFQSLKQLQTLLSDYVHWYNYERIHSSIDYRTPISLRLEANKQQLPQPMLINCPKKG